MSDFLKNMGIAWDRNKDHVVSLGGLDNAFEVGYRVGFISGLQRGAAMTPTITLTRAEFEAVKMHIKEALKEKPSYTDDAYEGWAIHFHDTITYALKLVAKLEQGPSEG